jgi:hypothetical protein
VSEDREGREGQPDPRIEALDFVGECRITGPHQHAFTGPHRYREAMALLDPDRLSRLISDRSKVKWDPHPQGRAATIDTDYLARDILAATRPTAGPEP